MRAKQQFGAILLFAISAAFFLGALIGSGGYESRTNYVSCYEDEVIAWSGTTNNHSICLAVDNTWMLQEVK